MNTTDGAVWCPVARTRSGSVRVAKHWDRLPREMLDSTLGAIQTPVRSSPGQAAVADLALTLGWTMHHRVCLVTGNAAGVRGTKPVGSGAVGVLRGCPEQELFIQAMARGLTLRFPR